MSMWITMLEFISGGRPDNTPWPDKGVVFEVSDEEGVRLIRGQLAQQVRPPAPPEPNADVAGAVTTITPSATETEAAEIAAPAAAAHAAVAPAEAAADAAVEAAAAPVAHPEPEPEPEPAAKVPDEPAEESHPQEALKPETAPEPVQPPAPADSKAAWVEYAVSQGASPEEAAGQTKAQLQSAFGGRL